MTNIIILLMLMMVMFYFTWSWFKKLFKFNLPSKMCLHLCLFPGCIQVCEYDDPRVFAPLFYLNNNPDIENVKSDSFQLNS